MCDMKVRVERRVVRDGDVELSKVYITIDWSWMRGLS